MSTYLRAGRMFVELDLSFNCVVKVIELSFIDLLNSGIVFISQVMYLWLVCTSMYNFNSNKKKSKGSFWLTTDHITTSKNHDELEKVTYNPYLKLQLPYYPHRKVIAFQALSNWFTFMTSYSILQSCDSVLWLSCHFPAKDTHWTSWMQSSDRLNCLTIIVKTIRTLSLVM